MREISSSVNKKTWKEVRTAVSTPLDNVPTTVRGVLKITERVKGEKRTTRTSRNQVLYRTEGREGSKAVSQS